MTRKFLAVIALVATFVNIASAQDAKTVIANASKASGYDNLNTIEFIGGGSEGAGMGQMQSAKAGWVQNQVKSYSRFIDLAAGTSQRNAITSRPLDATGQLPGGGGLGAAGARADMPTTANIAATANFTQKLDVTLSPPGFLKLAASAADAKVTTETTGGKRYTVISFPVTQMAPSGLPYKVTGYINSQTNMVERVVTAIEDTAPFLIGDVVVDQTLSDYKDFSGVKFPTKIVQTRGGVLWTNLTITEVKANAAAPAPIGVAGGGRGGAAPGGGGAAPGGRGGAPGGGAGGGQGAGRGGAAAVGNRKLGDGVYVITGSYRSMAIEFKDHIVFIEANQNSATTTPAIEEAKRLIPNKPVRYVINTHNHFDHAGGLRAAALEGATIITHELNKPLYEQWFANPRTLAAGGPDDLEKSGKKAKFEYVGESKILKDDTNTVEIYHIKGVVHGEDILVVYMPKLKVLYESDTYNAGQVDAPARTGAEIDGFEKQFANELDRMKIDYTHIVPSHQPNPDREVTRAEFLKRVGR